MRPKNSRPSRSTDSSQTTSRNARELRSPVNSSQRERRSRSVDYSARSRRQANTNREIYELQTSTHLLIPKLPFARLVREILLEFGQYRVQLETIGALHEASEIFLVQLFEDSIRCTQHRDRVTLMPKDMNLAMYLRGMNL